MPGRRPVRLVLVVVTIAVAGILARYLAFVSTQGDAGPVAYIEAMCAWDCAWYRTIAEGGYDLGPGTRLRPGAANWAFFPLSPMIAGALSRITAIPADVGGFALSNIYATLAAIAARPLFDGNAKAYWLYVVMLLAGPFSFLFSSLHTEALFILLSTLALVALRHSDPLAGGIWTALLSATRLTGVLMTVSILVARIADHLREGVRPRDIAGRVFADGRLVLGLAIAPLGLFLYALYLRLHTGDGLAFLHIQRAWGRSLGNPLDTLAELTRLTFPLSPASMIVGTWLLAAFAGLALSVVLAVRRRYAEAAFCALCILVSLSGGATSMVRFVAGLAPLGIVTAELLSLSALTYYAAFPAMVAFGLFASIGWMNSSLFAM